MPDLPPPRPPAADSPGVALAAMRGIAGWLTEDQAMRLWHASSRLAAGSTIVEIGSFRGRSTVVLALGAPGGEIVAIDPHAGNDRGPQEIRGFEQQAQNDFDAFHANLTAAGVDAQVRHVRRFSGDAEAEVHGDIDLLFIDGAHRFCPARDDLLRWGQRVPAGGHVLVHDAFSSVGVTLALAAVYLASERYRYVGRSGSLVEYHVTSMTPVQRGRNAVQQLVQLPWFARNVVIKMTLIARLPRLARALGHDGETWPY